MTIGLLIEKKLAQVAWMVTAAAALNTLLNFLLIPPLGVLGAAAATAIAYMASALLTAIRAQRAHPFPMNGAKLALFLQSTWRWRAAGWRSAAAFNCSRSPAGSGCCWPTRWCCGCWACSIFGSYSSRAGAGAAAAVVALGAAAHVNRKAN